MIDKQPDMADPTNWADGEPGKQRAIIAQRDAFRQRSESARKALNQIRTAYEAGDFDQLERLLFLHSAFNRGKIKRPEAIASDIRR